MSDSFNNDSEDELYNVEKILDKKKVGGKVLYKVKWEGYDINQCTWEPLKNLFNVQKFINEFERKNKQNNKKILNKKHKRNKSIVNKKKIDENNKDKNKKSSSYSKKNDDEIVSNFYHSNSIKKNQIVKREKSGNKSNTIKSKNSGSNLFKIKKNFIDNDDESDTIDKIYPEYKYDESYNKVLSIKKSKNGILCKVEYIDENNFSNVKNILAKNLRKINPNILLDFYENKIKFVRENN